MVCDMQLTDEPDKRCYPLGEHLLCRGCHLAKLDEMGCRAPPELQGVAAQYNILNWFVCRCYQLHFFVFWLQSIFAFTTLSSARLPSICTFLPAIGRRRNYQQNLPFFQKGKKCRHRYPRCPTNSAWSGIIIRYICKSIFSSQQKAALGQPKMLFHEILFLLTVWRIVLSLKIALFRLRWQMPSKAFWKMRTLWTWRCLPEGRRWEPTRWFSNIQIL